MPWPLVIFVFVVAIVGLMLTGMPIFFAFAGVCTLGAFLIWGGFNGFQTLTDTIFSSLAQFDYVPLPMFILMGTIIFEAGIGERLTDTCNLVLGRLPGRLSIVAIATGTLLATLTGSSTASDVILARGLLPNMYRYNYKNEMAVGAILAGGQLAPMIPPSTMAIFLGGVGGISVGQLLIAIIIPGLLMAAFYVIYSVVRCWLQPSLAPSYNVPQVPLTTRLMAICKNILPLAIVIFGVIGVIFFGIATPEEAAGSGVVACYILAALYKKLTWKVIKTSAITALEFSVMLLMIITMAMGFAKLLAFSGAINSLVVLASSLPVHPLLIVFGAQVVILFLGMFLGPPSIILLTMPVYIPVVIALGYDPVWFGVMVLINTELSLLTPPIGLNVFVMQGFAPKGTTTTDVFRAVMPYLAITIFVSILVLLIPGIAMWLPSLMKT